MSQVNTTFRRWSRISGLEKSYSGQRGYSGLGSAGDILYGSVIDTGFGTTVDCSKWSSFLFNSGCWKYTFGSWGQMAALSPPPVLPMPPHAVGAGTSTVPAPYACQDGSLVTAATNCPEYSAALDTTIQQIEQENRQNILAGVQSLPDNPVPGVDCSTLWNMITDSSCWGFDPSGYVVPILIGLGAVIVFGMVGSGGSGSRRR